MASLQYTTGNCSRCGQANRQLLYTYDPSRGPNHLICAECVYVAQPVAQVAASWQQAALATAVATAVAGAESEKEQQSRAAALQRQVEDLQRALEAQQKAARTAAAEAEELRDDLATARAELDTQSREKLALEERVGSLRAELEGALQRSERLEAESGDLQRLQHEMESRAICETLQWYTMSDRAYTIRTKPLGSTVSFASDGLAYNISKVPCEVENGTKRRSVRECRLMSVVNIEIPGLVLEGFQCWANHKTASKETGKANLAVKTQRCDVSKQEEVRIELRAELISTPPEPVQSQSSMGTPADKDAEVRKPWVTFTEFSMGDVTCYGEQNRDVIHERGTRFLLWDDSKPPLFCYSGGVLSIGFPCKDLLTDADRQTYVNSSAREPESES